jgi:hypothetical protein
MELQIEAVVLAVDILQEALAAQASSFLNGRNKYSEVFKCQ